MQVGSLLLGAFGFLWGPIGLVLLVTVAVAIALAIIRESNHPLTGTANAIVILALVIGDVAIYYFGTHG